MLSRRLRRPRPTRGVRRSSPAPTTRAPGSSSRCSAQTRQACIERDRRIAYLQTELDLSRAEGASQLRALATLGSELEELRVSSRGQATRIRLGALREAAEVSGRIRALAGAPEAAAEGMLAALERALERLGNDWEGAEEGSTSRVEAGPVQARRRSGPGRRR